MTDVMAEHDAHDWARRWVDAWNDHDVEAVLAHFSEDVEFTSPVAAAVTGAAVVHGRDALRAYWTGALARNADLHFEVDDVHVGSGCLAILYRNQTGRRVTEIMVFGADGMVTRGYALYAADETRPWADARDGRVRGSHVMPRTKPGRGRMPGTAGSEGAM